MKRIFFLTALVLVTLAAAAQQGQRGPRRGYTTTVLTHDPVMAWEDGVCYLYGTGNNLQQMTSEDMVQWQYANSVLKQPPEWIGNHIQGCHSSVKHIKQVFQHLLHVHE